MIQVVMNNIVPYGGRYMTLGVYLARRVRPQPFAQLLADFRGRHFQLQRRIDQQMTVRRGLQHLSWGAARSNFCGNSGRNRCDVKACAGFHAHVRKFKQAFPDRKSTRLNSSH